MDMTRRGFLKGLGAMLVLSQVPQVLIPKFGSGFAGHRTVKPVHFQFKGTRYPAYFARIMRDPMKYDIDALRTHEYDIRQMLMDANVPRPDQLKGYTGHLISPDEHPLIKIPDPLPEILIKWNDGPTIIGDLKKLAGLPLI